MYYKIYCGLNDKDTHTQKITTKNAVALIERITLSHFEGATISTARGIYKHYCGAVVRENTVVIEILQTDREKIENFCAVLRRELNQESILYHAINSDMYFYM